ncbi:CRISPR locus-related DNA-binding protein [Natrarchaeobius halalkaliphilus]|uniref:CRISPR locus-related DNA-binding protein n=1 Tax=Natrarchaeobius halalkaliphilus TaxID=1679091 RepID=A0A3N6LYR2_9EURY|nr:CRISPR-associated CARF protein Csa3 [Natrarchaeobius halalkaliphilus]RQG93014.1 CRISPR locus-related DNA-binding protein [Natrarchaeobius halalkaliphilus]
MRTYVSPIGFNTTSVTRTVLNQDLDKNDVVVLIRPEHGTDDDRASEAIADVEQLLQEIEPSVSVSIARIPHDDFSTAVMSCSDVLRAAEGSVIVNLGGGARDVVVPLTIATVAHAHEIDSMVGFSDIDGNVREWELPTIPSNTSRGATETLELIGEVSGSVSIPMLEQQCELAKSTVTRHVNQLETEGLVTSRTKDRTKHVEITLGGQLYLASSGSA